MGKATSHAGVLWCGQCCLTQEALTLSKEIGKMTWKMNELSQGEVFIVEKQQVKASGIFSVDFLLKWVLSIRSVGRTRLRSSM